jgi:CubicO group peptidase (beta-lactamase class C family)
MSIKLKYTTLLVGLIGFHFSNQASCQNPKNQWKQFEYIEQAGFSREKLQRVKQYYDSLQSSAFMIVQDGKVVAAWGEINRRFKIASIRKSLLNSLYGIYHDNEIIDLNLTLDQLNISDKDSLSKLEKSAKIIHLLKTRSGVYHKAAAETEITRQLRPERNSHPPDSFWYYNNWDFNVLGAIFEKITKTSVYEAFNEKIAAPLQMEDFRMMDGNYFYEPEYSIYPAYHFKMTARDLARYGQLYLQEGFWNNKKIISKEWVEESTFPHSKHEGGTKIGRWYGYLWGVSEYFQNYRMYFASGVGGQFLAIFPTENLVIVNLCDTYKNNRLLDRELTRLFDLILESKVSNPVVNPKLIPLKTKYRVPENLYHKKLDYSKYVGDFKLDDRQISISILNKNLIIKDFDQRFNLYPISPTRFFIDDLEKYINVDLDKKGNALKVYYDPEK